MSSVTRHVSVCRLHSSPSSLHDLLTTSFVSSSFMSLFDQQESSSVSVLNTRRTLAHTPGRRKTRANILCFRTRIAPFSLGKVTMSDSIHGLFSPSLSLGSSPRLDALLFFHFKSLHSDAVQQAGVDFFFVFPLPPPHLGLMEASRDGFGVCLYPRGSSPALQANCRELVTGTSALLLL